MPKQTIVRKCSTCRIDAVAGSVIDAPKAAAARALDGAAELRRFYADGMGGRVHLLGARVMIERARRIRLEQDRRHASSARIARHQILNRPETRVSAHE